jgi:hypothetical protein
MQATAGFAALAAAGTRPYFGRAADGETKLLAVGISTIPFETFSWRLVRDMAPEFGSGEELERALGFVYSPDGRLRLTADDPLGSGLVFEGKAAFIPEAILQRQESAEGGPLSYLRVGLVVPDEAAFGAGGEVLFDSNGGAIRFLASPGRYAIRLYRVDLGPNSEVPLPTSGPAPVLLHVLDGQAGVGTSGDGDPTPLSAGQTILAGQEGQDTASQRVIRSGVGATLLMAVIGEEVPEDGTGTIQMAIFACNEGLETGCDLSNSFDLQIEGEGITLTGDDLLSHEGDLITPELPFGTYRLIISNDYSLELNPSDEGTIGPINGNTALHHPITLTPENANVVLTLRHPK